MVMIKNIYMSLAIELARVIFLALFCHFVGDYLFQTSYMAREKKKSLWVLTAHCFCYSTPFLLMFGLRWQLIFVLVTHFIIDWGKAWKNWYGLFFDQYFHIVVALTYIFPVLSEGSWKGIPL